MHGNNGVTKDSSEKDSVTLKFNHRSSKVSLRNWRKFLVRKVERHLDTDAEFPEGLRVIRLKMGSAATFHAFYAELVASFILPHRQLHFHSTFLTITPALCQWSSLHCKNQRRIISFDESRSAFVPPSTLQ
ncbi:hypothetical protein HN011_008357 [Eciton burchellii]|nr:hypothetical protein HN011_008357 [Eciton burchellii]